MTEGQESLGDSGLLGQESLGDIGPRVLRIEASPGPCNVRNVDGAVGKAEQIVSLKTSRKRQL